MIEEVNRLRQLVINQDQKINYLLKVVSKIADKIEWYATEEEKAELWDKALLETLKENPGTYIEKKKDGKNSD